MIVIIIILYFCHLSPQLAPCTLRSLDSPAQDRAGTGLAELLLCRGCLHPRDGEDPGKPSAVGLDEPPQTPGCALTRSKLD